MSTSRNPFIRFLEKLGQAIPDEETGKRLVSDQLKFWTTLDDDEPVDLASRRHPGDLDPDVADHREAA